MNRPLILCLLFCNVQASLMTEKEAVERRRAKVTLLDTCTKWREELEEEETRALNGHLLTGNLATFRDLAMRHALLKHPIHVECLEGVNLEDTFPQRLEESPLKEILSRTQMIKLDEILDETGRVDLITQSLQNFLQDLPSWRRDQLVDEFFGRRKKRSVEESQEHQDNGPVPKDPEPLSSELLRWQTPRQRKAVLRVGESQWERMAIIADQFYHLRKSIRLKYKRGLREYCNDNIKRLLGEEKFEQLTEDYMDNEQTEHVVNMYHQLVGELQDEVDKLTADHYGKFCQKIYRLIPFEATDLTSWLKPAQKMALAKLIQDSEVKDGQVYDLIYEFYNSITGDEREDVEELMESGCRKFITHNFGDEVSEELDDMLEHKNSTSQAMAAYLVSFANEITDVEGRKRTNDALSICKRIYLNYDGSCKCNGKSTECDSATHNCKNCTEDSAGVQCELCKEGFEKAEDDSCAASQNTTTTSIEPETNSVLI